MGFYLSDCQAAVTLSVTPSTVNSTYAGVITLQIGGLAISERVVVQKFLDLNTNSIINTSDWLVQQFNLTDGQAGMVIGGVTNINVPGDTDFVGGQITAKLNFKNGDIVQNIIGKYLYKVSSPSGHFTPITNLFSVTNFPYAQKFIGNVVSNATGTVVSNALVLLFPPPRPGDNGPSGDPVAGVIANNSGSYSIPVPSGTYMPVAFKSNYLANFAAMPILTLGDGATITTNIVLTSANSSISGKVVDASNVNIRLPGSLLIVEATNGFLGISFTDTNGNFTTRVRSSPAQWGLRPDDTSLIFHGYVGLQDGTNANAGRSGVTLTVPKATALFYGSVKDNLGNPLAGVDVYAHDNNQIYQSDGYTDANGNYAAGALGGLSNDPWRIEISSDTGPANYIFPRPNFGSSNGTNLSANTAVQINFTALLATNHLSGHVQQGNGNPIGGVWVWASCTTNSVNYFQNMNADGNGDYSLNVANGNWTVGLSTSGGSGSLDAILGSGNYQIPGNQNVTINDNDGTANFIVRLCAGVEILTTNLSEGQVGSYYDIVLQGSSCNGTFNWALNDPQHFPPSLSLSGNGEIQGTPSTNGTYQFSVRLDDGNGHSTNQALSLYIAPALWSLKWSRALNGGPIYYSSPAIGPGGTIYVGSGAPFSFAPTRGLYALNPDGTLKWQYTGTNMPSMFTPSVGGDGTIYVQDYSSSLYAINTNGTLKWKYPFSISSEVGQTAPAIALDGTIYVGADCLYAINPDGTLKWRNTSWGGNVVRSSPAIAADGTVYVGKNLLGSELLSINPDGTLKWYYVLEGADWVFSSPAIGADGTIYIGAEGSGDLSYVYSVNSDGTLKWRYDVSGGRTVRSSPTIGVDGTIYIGTKAGATINADFLALNPDGTLKWRYAIDVAAADIYCTPTIGADGIIYFGAETSFLYALNPDGTLAWKYRTVNGINWTSPAIDNQGVIYIGNNDGTLFAINSSSMGLAGSAWPKFRNNNRNTGAFPISSKPILSALGWLTNRFQMRLTGATGQNYTVQTSTNLASPNWISLLITNNPLTNSFIVIDPAATNAARIYRALIGP